MKDIDLITRNSKYYVLSELHQLFKLIWQKKNVVKKKKQTNWSFSFSNEQKCEQINKMRNIYNDQCCG